MGRYACYCDNTHARAVQQHARPRPRMGLVSHRQVAVSRGGSRASFGCTCVIVAALAPLLSRYPGHQAGRGAASTSRVACRYLGPKRPRCVRLLGRRQSEVTWAAPAWSHSKKSWGRRNLGRSVLSQPRHKRAGRVGPRRRRQRQQPGLHDRRAVPQQSGCCGEAAASVGQ